MVYAGFWKRLGAGLLDVMLLVVISMMIGIVYGIVEAFFYELTPENFEEMHEMILMIISLIIFWFYYAFFQSSKYQATPGMMALSLRIVGYDEKRISFWRATGRFFVASTFSSLLGIGYLMIAFTPRKQALHDYIAKTLVVKNEKKILI